MCFGKYMVKCDLRPSILFNYISTGSLPPLLPSPLSSAFMAFLLSLLENNTSRSRSGSWRVAATSLEPEWPPALDRWYQTLK